MIRIPFRRQAPPEQSERAGFFEAARTHTPLLAARAADGALYLVSTQQRGHSRVLFAKGTSPEMRVVGDTLATLDALGVANVRERTFVDIGANIGTSTITALRQGFRDAVACEPAPENVKLLRMNLIANDLDGRVRVVAAAISDREGTVSLALAKSGACEHRVVDEPPPKGATIDVESVTLDGLVERGELRPEDVGLLWIDAEGHEPHVLRGARTLLERRIPIVLEYNAALLGENGTDALQDLTAGYEVRDLRGEQRNKRLEPSPPLTFAQLAERYPAGGRHTDVLLVAG